MIYTTLQNITNKRCKKKKLQSNTVTANAKPCQYSLLATLKVNEKKKRKWIKISKRSMWFSNVIANYGKQMVYEAIKIFH